jgi:uncharacterized protein with HEPN domain
MLAVALIRCLEVLGEAASKLTDAVRLRFPGVPFAKNSLNANRLIHAYFDVDPDIVWTTVSEDLPSLLPVLESVLAEIDC